MTGMRFTPKGYGGHRRNPDEVKRDGWREQGVLAVAIDDHRLTWPERELVRQLGEKLYGTAIAAWYCWHASRRQAMLEACWEKAGAFVHQQIIWVKDRGVLTRSHYLWKHEPCFMGWRRPNRPPKVAEETLPSTWALPSFARDERPDHPTSKPLDAFGIPMRQHVARGGLCYEPFCGSGSQIMAGEANGRRVYAMEISPAYIDVAVERWQADTGREAILDGDGRSFTQVRAERLGDEQGIPHKVGRVWSHTVSVPQQPE